MPSSPISQLNASELDELSTFVRFLTGSKYALRDTSGDQCDFVLGNPHEPLVAGFSEALRDAAVPQDNSWFAYKMSEPAAQQVVADSLLEMTGLSFDPEDVVMTSGAFAGLALSFRTILDPGDEVVYIDPPWFFYRTIIRSNGGIPVPVSVIEGSWDLDLPAIEAAITSKTRAILINSPHNPTGKIFGQDRLAALADLLKRKSAEHGRTIYAVSDEAYRRILFDGNDCPTIAAYYPATLLIYTYGKTLLTPGQRLGYVAWTPQMAERETLRLGFIASQIMNGYTFPNALMQHSISTLEKLSIDIDHLQDKRDHMVDALRDIGYEVTRPEGTFYVIVKAPGGDDIAFSDRLADQNVFVLPGAVFDLPGYFRISLTANDDMIERAVPVFAEAFAAVV